MRNTLTIDQVHAINRMIMPIYKGELDFSKKEKAFYVFAAGVAACLSYVSAKMYLIIGGSGTRFLPIGNFSKRFGGIAAFGTNASFNCYITMDTLITTRNAYYQYKIAKRLKITPPLWVPLVKLSIAALLAATTGIVFGLIADVTHSIYNQAVTGGTNILLNYLGSIALELLLAIVFSYIYKIYKKMKEWLYKKASINTQELKESAKWVVEHVEARGNALKNLPNDSGEWNMLKTPYGYQNFILSPNESTRLLNESKRKSPNRIEKITSLISHLLMQFFDKVALYGYFLKTVTATGNLFKIKNEAGKYITGTAFFLPFGMLSSKVVFDTTNNIISLTKIGVSNTTEFIKNPDWSKETFIKLSFIIPAATLAVYGYFIAYVSANTSLGLNADYGLTSLWSVYSTCAGAATFNGYGFLEIIIKATVTLMGLKLYSKTKRDVLSRHNQFSSLLFSYPDGIDRLAEKECFGLMPLNDQSAYYRTIP